MGWDPPNKTKYLYKRIKFGRVEGESKRFKVFTIVNPVGTSKAPSYLQRWDPKSYTIEQALPIEGSTLSALATSDNGHFVATGSMFDGTVEIYIAFNLTVSIFFWCRPPTQCILSRFNNLGIIKVSKYLSQPL